MSSMVPAHTGSATSTLFGGSRFWVSHNVPTRSKITELIKQNGGVMVPTEKGADMKIVDPVKKNLPSSCCSYRYVELSVRNGRLEDPENHRAGPSDQRPMGASNIPKKGTRTDYTLEEDQLLWDYLEPYEKSEAPTSGQNIYKELAQKHPVHSWQSWRSRYLRVVRGKPRPGGPKPRSDATENPPPHVPAQLPLVSTTHKENLPSSTRVERSIDLKRKRDPRNETVPSPTRKRTVGPADTAEPATSTWSESQQLPMASPSQHRADSTRQGDLPMSRKAGALSNAAQVKTSSPEAKNVTDALFMELPFLQLEPDSEGEDNDDDLDGNESDDMSVESWIDAQVRKGVSDRASVKQALLHTSMDTVVTLELLKTWSAGEELPNMPGVWTPEDDKCLEADNARCIEQVHRKHGDEACDNRWEYLSICGRLKSPPKPPDSLSTLGL